MSLLLFFGAKGQDRSRNPLRLFLLASVFAVQGEAHDVATPASGKAERLGEVNFPVSCNAAAQLEFNRGMALFHSFWHEPANASFAKVLELDPGCGMAYWGISIMSMGNPWSWASNRNATKAGAPAAAQAQRVSARTERERDYIAALGLYFKDWETTEFRPRIVAFEQSMASLASKYPDDDEARIVYALVLNISADPADRTLANEHKAVAILEPLFIKYPSHPGVAHYLIHTYDYTDLADKGLPSARLYSSIAPSAPHALHMPSHIFSRLGMWKETMESNRASYLAAKGQLTETTLNLGAVDALHAMDYLVFGHLQLGQDQAAKRVVDEAAALPTAKVENFASTYAFAAMPARYAVERSDWAQAARLALTPSYLAWNRFPQAEAILVFARGLGAARLGDVTAARKDADRLQTIKDAMVTAKVAYWPVETDFQIKTINAWIALAEKRNDDALQLMHAAADLEESTDKHPVTPGNIVPCRELLGDMLLQLNQPAAALAEYERSLKRDQNRLRTIYGAARSAEAAGNEAAARQYYAKLQTLTAERDSDRPEFARAKAYLAAR